MNPSVDPPQGDGGATPQEALRWTKADLTCGDYARGSIRPDASRSETYIAVLRDILRAAESERGNEFASLVGGWASTALAGLCVVCNQNPCATPEACRAMARQPSASTEEARDE